MTVVASGYDLPPNELFETEPWATRALLRHLPVAGLRVWEPCAGNHKIVDVLRAAGADMVVPTDIATYTRPHVAEFDFFSDSPDCRWYFDALITNPPYGPGNRLAVKFARLALERCDGWVALLLTAKFDFGKTRADLFADNARFAFKLSLVDRIQWFAGEYEGTESHAWYVWEPAGLHLHRSPRLFYGGRDDVDA